jgi:hypothetical protein
MYENAETERPIVDTLDRTPCEPGYRGTRLPSTSFDILRQVHSMDTCKCVPIHRLYYIDRSLSRTPRTVAVMRRDEWQQDHCNYDSTFFSKGCCHCSDNAIYIVYSGGGCSRMGRQELPLLPSLSSPIPTLSFLSLSLSLPFRLLLSLPIPPALLSVLPSVSHFKQLRRSGERCKLPRFVMPFFVLIWAFVAPPQGPETHVYSGGSSTGHFSIQILIDIYWNTSKMSPQSSNLLHVQIR